MATMTKEFVAIAGGEKWRKLCELVGENPDRVVHMIITLDYRGVIEIEVTRWVYETKDELH